MSPPWAGYPDARGLGSRCALAPGFLPSLQLIFVFVICLPHSLEAPQGQGLTLPRVPGTVTVLSLGTARPLGQICYMNDGSELHFCNE